MSERIGLNRVHFPVRALGPGRRVGVWVQGCSIGCRGCMSLDTWTAPTSTEPVRDVLDRLSPWLEEADGVTISGGEPFDQPNGLHALLSGLCARPGMSVLVYSGYRLETLVDRFAATLPLIDVLISEPFDEDQAEPALLRGSSNQVVTCLTQHGIELWQMAVVAGDQAPAIDIVAEPDGAVWFAGIPRPRDLARLSSALASRGMTAKTSAGRLGGKS